MSEQFLEKLNKVYYHIALEQYSIAALKLGALAKTSPTYEVLIVKAIASIKLNKIEDGLKDCEAAISMDESKYEGHYYKGICHFWQSAFDKALACFETANGKLTDSESDEVPREQIVIWMGKTKAELSNKRTLVDAKFGERKTNTIPQKEEEKKAVDSLPEKKDIPKPISQPTSSQIKPFGKILYIWRQTDNRVYIEIKYALEKKDSLKITFEKEKLDVSFIIDSSRNYELSLELFDEIEDQSSYHNIHLDKIEVVLAKKNKGKTWPTLENPETKNEVVLETKGPQPIAQPINIHDTPLAYPTSSKSKKDWSKIDKEIEEDMKKNKDEYQEGDPLNSLFKQIYASSDEDTRRAMMKSFQESGGTVLSTNWKEVKEKDYKGKDRPNAPEGQEWRAWEKQV